MRRELGKLMRNYDNYEDHERTFVVLAWPIVKCLEIIYFQSAHRKFLMKKDNV